MFIGPLVLGAFGRLVKKSARDAVHWAFGPMGFLAFWPRSICDSSCQLDLWPYGPCWPFGQWPIWSKNIVGDVVYRAFGPICFWPGTSHGMLFIGPLALLASLAIWPFWLLAFCLNCAGYQRLAACSRAACSLQLMVCSLPLVARSLPFAACSLQRAACGLQLEACSLHLAAIPQNPFLRTRSRLGPGTNRSQCAPMGPNGPMTPHIDWLIESWACVDKKLETTMFVNIVLASGPSGL